MGAALFTTHTVTKVLLIVCWAISCGVELRAQAPPSIQFFMPDGSLPPHELRFSLVSEDGRVVDFFYTDSKGRFLMTASQGLRANIGYTVTIQSDGRTFDTTSVFFKYYTNTVYYVPIFLKPLEPKTQPAGVVDVAELDQRAPAPARDAYDAGMKALSEGRVDEAVNELKRSISIYSDNFRALNDLGVILMKLNRLEESATAFGQAIKVAPRVHYARLNLGIVWTRQKKYNDAVDLLGRLHKDYPELAEVRVAFGDVLMAVDRLDDAEKHLRAALASKRLVGDAASDAHYKLGLCLNRKQKYEGAARELEIAAKELPNAAQVRLQYGGALLQLRRLGEAERELLATYRLAGAELGGAQFLLGQLYFIQRKYESARRAFEQYLIDVPQAPNAAEVKGVIEKIKAALAPK